MKKYKSFLAGLATLAVVVGLVASTSLLVPITAGAATTVNVWISSADTNGPVLKLQPQTAVTFATDSPNSNPIIQVNDTQLYQKWEGGGASFTDSAAYLVNEKLSATLRDQLMSAIFDPNTGIGVSYLRNPMGASDLTRVVYSYDDTCCDLSDFSINYDLTDILPLTKQARTLNPELTLQMNAWSPPAWMKDNNSMIGGGILPTRYQALADYYVKTIQGYEAQGVHVNYVTLNNEPTCCSGINYPSVWNITSANMSDMLKNYWFPDFQANGLTTKILLLDFNWQNRSLVEPLLQDSAITSSPFYGGVAYHGYGGDPSVMTELHNLYGAKAYVTERSGFGNDWGQFRQDFQDMINSARNWGGAFVKWPVATDENRGPHTGGCSTCTGLATVHIADAQAGQYTLGVEYYSMGHFTKFVRNGAYRAYTPDIQTSGVWNVAFKNPDNSIALIAFNPSNTAPVTFKVLWNGQSFNYTLQASQAATFKWCCGANLVTPTPQTTLPPPLSRSGWTATASSNATSDVPQNMLDGDSGTRWSTGTPQVNGQWIRVDMGAAKTFDEVVLDVGNSFGDYPRGYQLFVSNDGTNWGSAIASGVGDVQTFITFPAQTARYIKVVQTGSASSWWSAAEFLVYNTGAPTATPTQTNTPGPSPTPTATSTPTNTPIGGCGTTNIALNKTATASSVTGANTAALAVDGNTGTRWESLYSDPQWIYVDLGTAQNICHVKLNWETAYGKAYQIQTSNDATTWTTIYSTTTSDGGIDDLTGLNGSGRYVRMYGTVRATQYGYSLWEYEIYAGTSPTATPGPTPTKTNTPAPATNTPTKTNTPTGPTATPTNTPTGGCGTTNKALNKPATASSLEGAGYPASAAVDGSTTTRWSSAFSDPQWIYVDLGSTQSVCHVKLNWETAYGKSYQIQTSPDATTWTTIYSTTTGDGGIDDLTGLSGSGRYIRMYGTVRGTGYGYSLWEFEIY